MPICGRELLCLDYCGDRPGLCGLFRVTWDAPGGLAAVLVWDQTARRGSLWTNRRLVRGRADALVHRWALHRVWTGQAVCTLDASDLAALPCDSVTA